MSDKLTKRAKASLRHGWHRSRAAKSWDELSDIQRLCWTLRAGAAIAEVRAYLRGFVVADTHPESDPAHLLGPELGEAGA